LTIYTGTRAKHYNQLIQRKSRKSKLEKIIINEFRENKGAPLAEGVLKSL